MEVFDSKPARIQWITKNNRQWVGVFIVADLPIRISFVEFKGIWEVVFGVDMGHLPQKFKSKVKTFGDAFGIIGTGNQGKVFSTVLDLLKKFAKNIKPQKIAFTADEPSRMKLYKRMVTKFAPSLGYKPVATGDYFELHRKD